MSTDFVSRGQALVSSGQYQEAVKVCRLGLLGRPSEVGGRVVLGQALLALRRYDEVLAEMRVALDLEPSNAVAHQLRGEALLRKGDAHGAAEALGRAVALAPHDSGVAALAAEAGRAASSSGTRRPAISFGDPADGMTRHYPSTGPAGAGPGMSPGVGPAISSPGGQVAAGSRDASETGILVRPDTASAGEPGEPGDNDGTGTLEIDPGRDSVRVIDDGMDDPDDDIGRFDRPPPRSAPARSAAPLPGVRSAPVTTRSVAPVTTRGVAPVTTRGVAPAPRAVGSPAALTSSAPPRIATVDVGEDDVIAVEARDVLGGARGAASLRGPSVVDDYDEDQQTMADAQPHRRVAALTGADLDDPEPSTGGGDRGETSELVAELDGDLDADTTGSVAVAGASRAMPVAAPSAGQRAPASRLPIEAPPTRELPGVGTAQAASRPPSPAWHEEMRPPRGESPSLGLDDLRASRDDDMLTIRAGLGLGESSSASHRVVPPAAYSASPVPGAGSAASASASPSVSPAAGVGVSPPAKNRDRGERTRKVRTDPRGIVLPARREPRFVLALWIGMAILVIGAGVWGGFAIRDVRLSRQIAAARHAAAAASASDTWPGWRRARDIYAGIVDARDTVDTRAELALAQAVLAAEFGDDIAAARKVVAGEGAHPEGAVARGLIAIADGDPAAAARAADIARALASSDGEASYLAGRVALLDDRPDVAVEAFRAALRAEARPIFYLGLVEGQAARRDWPEAKAAADRALQMHPGHPGATIARARVLAASGALADGAEPSLPLALEALLAAGEQRSPTSPVAPAEAAMAGLALAEVHRASGDFEAARKAITRGLALGSEQRRFAEGAVTMLVSLGDLSTAARVADAAVARLPASAQLHVALAEIALRNGDPSKALAALAAAGDLSQRPEALAVRGRARLAQGDLEGAAVDLDAAVARAPELEAAVIARAELDLARGDARAAASRLEPRYRDSAPLELSITYATALREVGERERARAVLGRLTAAGGDSGGRAFLELARVERDNGNLKAARAAYAKAIEVTPAPATEARLEAALLALDASDPTGARDALDRLVGERPGDGRLLVEAGRAHILLGDLAGAKALLDKAEPLASAPRWLLAREHGRLVYRQRHIKEAVQSLERAVGLQPDDGETRLLLIDAQLAADDTDGAKRTQADLAKRFAGRPENLLARGRIDYYLGKNKDAKAEFGQARDRLVRDKAVPRRLADALAWLGRVAYESQDRNAARALLRQALTLDPSHADAWIYAGFVEEERKNPRGAASAFERASQLDPENVDNWFNFGKAAADSKQKKLAQTALEEYLKRAPKGPMADDARKLLSKL